MREDIVVYRTHMPGLLDKYKEACKKDAEWRDRVIDWAKTVHPDAQAVSLTSVGDHRLAGISMVDPIPEGWRKETRGQYSPFLVPFRSRKTGKSWAKQIDDLNKERVDVRKSLPGMPTTAFNGLRYMTFGVEIYEGVIYVIWSAEPESNQVDYSIWEKVKLSEYYRVKEEKQELTHEPA